MQILYLTECRLCNMLVHSTHDTAQKKEYKQFIKQETACVDAGAGLTLDVLDVLQVGTRALKDNMTVMGPYVLPLSEQLLFAANLVVRQLCR
jgi:3-ketoacyl-CoA synthase